MPTLRKPHRDILEVFETEERLSPLIAADRLDANENYVRQSFMELRDLEYLKKVDPSDRNHSVHEITDKGRATLQETREEEERMREVVEQQESEESDADKS